MLNGHGFEELRLEFGVITIFCPIALVLALLTAEEYEK